MIIFGLRTGYTCARNGFTTRTTVSAACTSLYIYKSHIVVAIQYYYTRPIETIAFIRCAYAEESSIYGDFLLYKPAIICQEILSTFCFGVFYSLSNRLTIIYGSFSTSYAHSFYTFNECQFLISK